MAKQRKNVPMPASTKAKEVPFAQANTTVRHELHLLWDVLGTDFVEGSKEGSGTSDKKKLKNAA